MSGPDVRLSAKRGSGQSAESWRYDFPSVESGSSSLAGNVVSERASRSSPASFVTMLVPGNSSGSLRLRRIGGWLAPERMLSGVDGSEDVLPRRCEVILCRSSTAAMLVEMFR